MVDRQKPQVNAGNSDKIHLIECQTASQPISGFAFGRIGKKR